MAKYKPDYWRNPDKPEPKDYATVAEPLHGDTFESGRDELIAFAKRVTESFKDWLDNHNKDIDSLIYSFKKEWIDSGGNNKTWETILRIALRDSCYAKRMSKEANNRKKPEKKEKPFNSLNFSGIFIKET